MIKKALITCAGFGTRFLPITKTIQKEMLPILNRPLVDYLVQDCVLAGIKEIIFVVNEQELELVKHYYHPSKLLEQHLEKMNKVDKKELLDAYGEVIFEFAVQSSNDEHGTAIPVKLAKNYLVNEEAFLVFMGDDFVYNTDGSSEAKAMIELFSRSKADALVTCITKPDSELFRYGVAEIVSDQGFTCLTNLVEKPSLGTAPSNLINISKYILTPKIFEIIDRQKVNVDSGEYYITDSITTLAQDSKVVVYTPKSRYLDGGNVLGWLKANLVVAKNDEKLKEELVSFIKEEFSY